MYDHYEPIPPLVCPICKTELNDWQGKSGPCALLVWVQGKRFPIDQRADEDSKLPPEALKKFTLPKEFDFSSDACRRHHVVATGTTKQDIWTTTAINGIRDLDGGVKSKPR